MNILIVSEPISSRHFLLNEIIKNDPDLILLLGDLNQENLADLSNIKIPKIGIYGKNCDKQYFQDLDISNNHMQVISESGYNWFGFEHDVSDIVSTRYYTSLNSFYNDKIDFIITNTAPFDLKLKKTSEVLQLTRETSPKIVFYKNNNNNRRIIIHNKTIFFNVDGVYIVNLESLLLLLK